MANNQTAQQKKGILRTVLIAVAVIVFVVFTLWYKMQQPVIISDGALKAYGAYIFEKPRLIKEFQLIDKNAQPFTKENLKGNWSLVFFGFTNCPDICPTTLSLFKDIKAQIADTEVAEDTDFLMVTLDPARDKPAALKQYIEYFDPSFKAVTGDFIEIHNLATNVNVAFKKVMLEGDNYTIDHSGNIVIINEFGDYQGFFRPPFDANKIKQAYRSIRYTHRR